MRNPEESYLVKLGLFVACAAGATVSMYRNKALVKWSWVRRLLHVVLGTLVAFYLTPLFLVLVKPYIRISESELSSFGFLIGLLGFKSIDILIDIFVFLANKAKK